MNMNMASSLNISNSNICRTCMTESLDLISIYKSDHKEVITKVSICDMLSFCTSLKITEDDGLPKYVCLPCYKQVCSAYSFYKICEESDRILREQFHLSLEQIQEKRNNKDEAANHNECDETYNISKVIKKQFLCNICGNMFGSNCYFQIHLNTHSGDKKYQCKFCEKSFTIPSSLNKHIKIHTDSRFHNCSVCDKSFASSDYLTTHMKLHNEVKSNKCRICDKRFRQISHLTVHMRTHSGEKPFKCQYCKSCFSTSSILKRHILTHTGKRAFKCKVCGLLFSQGSVLKRHIQVHTR